MYAQYYQDNSILERVLVCFTITEI